MNTELEDRLAGRMQRLAEQVPVPATGMAEDLARGRRRMRRRRAVTVAGALAVGTITVGGGYLAQASGPDGSLAAPAAPAASGDRAPGHDRNGEAAARTKKPGARKALEAVRGRSFDPRLQGFRAALAAALDPAGQHLDARVSNQQTGDRVLGTKLGWKQGPGLAQVAVSVARPGAAPGSFSQYFAPQRCTPAPAHPCREVRLPDGTTGQQQRRGGELAVYYTRPDGQVVLIAESTLFGNNSTVPAATLPATARQLLRAATDPRMSLDR